MLGKNVLNFIVSEHLLRVVGGLKCPSIMREPNYRLRRILPYPIEAGKLTVVLVFWEILSP